MLGIVGGAIIAAAPKDVQVISVKIYYFVCLLVFAYSTILKTRRGGSYLTYLNWNIWIEIFNPLSKFVNSEPSKTPSHVSCQSQTTPTSSTKPISMFSLKKSLLALNLFSSHTIKFVVTCIHRNIREATGQLIS